ncbi:MAG: hypothetical protein GX590_07165, partial [Lentisphaerae bacterium]|nr:hypothetical protein [Lentisphaerota bacterium]
MRRFATLTLGAALLAGATAWGDIHVAPTGDDSKTGENWAEALATIGAAVGRASAGDRILVSNGTYQVTSEVALTAGITIAGYGAREETIVSGPGAGSRVFRLAHADAVLENLTVTGGGVPAGDLKGAGVFLAAGTVRNCIIADNTPAVQYVYGVGLYMDGGVVSNCLIRGNRATMSSWSYSKGCGAHVAGGLLADSTLEENGLMTGNQGNQGGGLYLVDGVVSNCLIRANRVSSTNGRGAGVNMSGGQLLACRV